MGTCPFEHYALPIIEFVGGETQELSFHTYFYNGKKPFSLAGCTANFSAVNSINKEGAPMISKRMEVRRCGNSDNILYVTLSHDDTVDLCGKYIYQITIRDIDGDVEIPNHGVMLIHNNIDKAPG